MGEGFWGIFVGYLSLCVKESVCLFGLALLCFCIPPSFRVLCLFLLESTMSFVFTVFGYLGLIFVGLAALGALFMFPPVECLLLLVCGGLITSASFIALNAIEDL